MKRRNRGGIHFQKEFEEEAKKISESYAKESKNHFEFERTLTKMDFEITQNEMDSPNKCSDPNIAYLQDCQIFLILGHITLVWLLYKWSCLGQVYVMVLVFVLVLVLVVVLVLVLF